ncbi:MAG: hypothetical protein Q4G09_03155 [Clostridia bacterium]|nr:hypothetical protein [Clostridia bacterium]
MKPAQKVIKYLAIAFAVFLIINIFSSILFGLYIFADALELTTKEETIEEGFITTFEDTDIIALNIQL